MVFVSYSHRDQQALELLRIFLKPLERDGTIEFWSDRELTAGDDWRGEIQAAMVRATVALLLVSEHFLASDFIHKHELPCLLRRAEAGQLTLIPVFLRRCLVGFEEYPVQDLRTGELRRVKLAQYQGIGTPEEPLMDLRYEQRKAEYAALARKLAQLAGVETAEQPARRGAIASKRVAVRSCSHALTVGLERHDGVLHRRYVFRQAESLDGPALDLGTLESHIVRLDRAIATGDMTKDEGVLLSRILFDGEDTWLRVAKRLFLLSATDPRPMPDRYPVALRVQPRGYPRLAALPWRWAVWNGRRLADYGWTFATTDVTDPAVHVTTLPKSDVLMILPDLPGDLYSTGVGALLSVLRSIWKLKEEATCLRRVATSAELAEAVQLLRPCLVYVRAQGFRDVDGSGFLLGNADAPERLLLRDLARLLQGGKPPRALYLDTPGVYGVDAPTPPEVLRDQPLVVWNRATKRSTDSDAEAQRWLRAWLEEGHDPVEALHPNGSSVEMSSPALCVHARYSSWRTETCGNAPRRRLARLLLDRRAQKSRVFDEVSDLIRLPSLRVLALLGYGCQGDDVISFSDQIQNHLERQLARRGVLRWIDGLRLPIARHNLRETLADELCLQLGDPYGNLEDLLRHHAPKVVRPGQPSIVWLDWGTYGKGDYSEPPLTDLELEDYLEFVAVHLTGHCPPELCLVSHLTLEMAEKRFSDLQVLFEGFHDANWHDVPSFRLHLLEPLARVTRADLRAFLREPEYQDCTSSIVTELASRIIMTSTGGIFDETVRLIEEAERTSWLALLLRLRQTQGETIRRRPRITFE